MKVKCGDIEALADLYYHEALPSSVMEAFAAHMATCRNNCRLFVERYGREVSRRTAELTDLVWCPQDGELKDLEDV